MKKITIIAPSPIEGSGGVARIYNFAQALVENGHECSVYVFDANGRNALTLQNLAREFYFSEGYRVHTRIDAVGDCDLVIATRWDTPSIALQLNAKKHAYLVQDYEAYFNPVGDGSVLAERSYMRGFQPLTYGRWLAAKLSADFGNYPFFFDFASDTDAFSCIEPMEERHNHAPEIAFIYQADKTRRCPALGIEALGIVKHLRPDVKLHFVGTDQAPSLWYEFHNAGNLTIGELNELYNRCSVGLSLSTTNPSCNAFDMMAAGLPSVDVYRENNLYDIPSDGVLLAYQSPESIADAIIHLLDNPNERLARSQAGLRFMAERSRQAEVQSFVEAINLILDDRDQQARPLTPIRQLYDQPPVVAKVDRNAYVDAFLRKQSASDRRSRYARYWPSALEDGLKRVFGLASRDANLTYYPTSTSDRAVVVTPTAAASSYDRAEQLGRRLVDRLGLDFRLHAKLFDANFYVHRYPDVASSGMDPFRHFLRYGFAQGRVPSPFFEADWYSANLPEPLQPGQSAIEHYVMHGSALDLPPNSLFDPSWYLEKNPDVAASGMHPMLHYILWGENEGRQPSERFSTNWYRDANPDVVSANVSALGHFLQFGKHEGRTRTPPKRRVASGELTDVFSWSSRQGDIEPSEERRDQTILSDEQCKGQVSFDVWSTIIHRRCHPDEIKLRSARFLLLSAFAYLRPEFRSPIALMQARMAAENASAPNADFEYRFADAIDGWLETCLIPASSAAMKAELKAQLLEHEFEAESESIEVDTNVARTINSLQTPPLFISDFYMGGEFLSKLLETVGLKDRFVRGYASCDNFKNKRSGALFQHVFDDFQILPPALTHVGDNPVADVERPSAAGVNAVHYVSAADEERHEWYAKAFHQHCNGNQLLHYRRLLALTEKVASDAEGEVHGEAADLFVAGTRIGLLVFGYCLNIIEDAIARRSKEVVFFAREGILFKKIYDLIAEQHPLNVTIPPSRLLFVSRRATFAASLEDYSNEEFMRLWSMYSSQSPKAFANSLNLDTAKASEAAARVGIAPNADVLAPWNDAGFQAFLNDPEFKTYATGELNTQRELLSKYLTQEIDTDQSELMIVDIGWRGTIQDNFARVLRKPVRGHYLALLGFLNQQLEGSSKVGWLSDVNSGDDYTLREQPTPLEMVFNGAGGSTIGYREVGGQIHAVREIFDGEEALIEAMRACQEGMEAVIPSLANYVKLHGLMAADLLELNRKIADDLLDFPPPAIADAFGRLEHNETFGVGSVVVMDEMGFDEVSRTSPGPELHHNLKAWLGQRWPEGMSRQSVVNDWWRSATPASLASAPLSISHGQFPAVVKSLGSSLSMYVSASATEDDLEPIIDVAKGLIDLGFNAKIHVDGDARSIERHLLGTAVVLSQSWTPDRMATLSLATSPASLIHVSGQSQAVVKGYLISGDDLAPHLLGKFPTERELDPSNTFQHFTIGNWLARLTRENTRAKVHAASFGVDTQVYRRLEGLGREDAICLFHQPENPGIANDLALRVAEMIKQRRPESVIYVFGSDVRPALACDVIHLGRLTHAQSNDLYNRCRVGVRLDVVNASPMGLEMAAAGCRPVNIYRYNNLMDHLDDVSLLAFESAHSLADAICGELGSDTYAPKQLSEKMTYRTREWQRDATVSNILRVLEGRLEPPIDIFPTFLREPIIAAEDRTPAVIDFCRRERELATKPMHKLVLEK